LNVLNSIESDFIGKKMDFRQKHAGMTASLTPCEGLLFWLQTGIEKSNEIQGVHFSPCFRWKYFLYLIFRLKFLLNSVCPQTHPVLSLRGAFCATKQSPCVTPGDCFGKKRLAMTGFGVFGQTLNIVNLN